MARRIVLTGIASHASRPGPPGAVLVSLYGGDWLALEWTAPEDTGANDPSTVAKVAGTKVLHKMQKKEMSNVK